MLSVYKASAGSGKTYTLTKEYIRMLLGEVDPATGRMRLSRERGRHRHTLAITFTNKATEEMKRRIIHQLAVLGGIEPGWTAGSPYEKELRAEMGCSEEELRQAAAAALRSLLLEFNRFNVSTIDSFFQMVLRAFAREAELTGNYEIALEKSELIQRSVAQLLNSLKTGADPEGDRRLISWLTQMMLSRIEEGNSFNVFNRNLSVFGSLVKFISGITDEEFDRHRDGIMKCLSDPARLERFQHTVIDTAERLISDALGNCRHLAAHISTFGYTPSLNSNTTGWIRKWSGEVLPDSMDLGKSILAVAEGCTDSQFKKGKKPHDPTLDMLMEAAARSVVICATHIKIYKDIRRNIYMLGLLARTMAIADELMVRDNMVMLSDTNYILSKIIGDGDAPFVYERVGVNLRHFLIDEFQDTSGLQWENLSILVNNGMSDGFDSLIIGDEKQCIYRFRNSDPNLLKEKVREEVTACFGEQYEEKSGPDYNVNWRSAVDVIEFNNRLFADLASRLGYGDVYANVEQRIPGAHSDYRGYVRVFCDEDRESVLADMLSNIRRQLSSGYKPGDIAVLVRGSKDGADVLRYVSSQPADTSGQPLRIVSDDAVMIGTSPTIRLIISVLQLLVSPGKPTAGSGRSVTQRALARLYHEFEFSLNEGKTRSEALRELLDRGLTGCDNTCSSPQDSADEDDPVNLAGMRCANLFSIVEEIVASPLLSDMATGEDNVFISTFQDMILDFNRRGGADIASFINYWNTTGCKVKVQLPPDEGAIRMMTIHKSKGLEFKCVHIPFADWKLFKSEDPEWFDIRRLPGLDTDDTPERFPLRPSSTMTATVLGPQYERLRRDAILDELNVAYVGLTRAVRELCFGICQIKSGYLGAEIAACLELSPGECREAGDPTSAEADRRGPVPALESRDPMSMPPYEPHPRPELWSHTSLDEDENVSAQRQRGLSYHGMLSQVRSMADIDKAAMRCVADGTLTEAEAHEHATRLKKMVAGHGIERWYEGYRRVVCEREIMTEDGRVLRPDRVVWLPDGSVEVIDYKTGEEYDRRHGRQVRRYVAALQKTGCRRVRGYIWYLDTDRIKEV